MAIAFARHIHTSSNTGTLSASLDCTGVDAVVILSVTVNTSATVSAITVGGVTPTLKGAFIQDSAGPRHYMYYLANPGTGSKAISVSRSGSGAIVLTAALYTGVNQTNPFNVYGTSAASTTGSYLPQVTTTADNTLVVAMSRTGNGSALTGASGVTVRQSPETTYLGAGGLWDSPAATAGVKTVGVTCVSQFFGGAHVFALTGSRKTLTPRTYLGNGYVHRFKKDSDGTVLNVPCTKAEYDAFALRGAPVLAGYTWLSSSGGTVKVDTADSTLGENEYTSTGDGNVFVNAKNKYGSLLCTQYLSSAVDASHTIDQETVNNTI